MKTNLIVILALLCSCAKQHVKTDIITADHVFISAQQPPLFVRYLIAKGHQYCDLSSYVPASYANLKFSVQFDSSAIYQCSDPVNQLDINKLYGFSDNNSDHHSYSARFGWRWSNGALRLFGYTYNNSMRESKELGIVTIGAVNDCAIKVTLHNYIFTLNGSVDSMSRESTTPVAIGYKLYPYFGGDEVSPHDIQIWIREN